MPAQTAPTPPAAPAAPAKPSVAVEAAKTTVMVSSLPTSAEPVKPPKPGTARAKMYDELRKKFGGEEAAPAEAPAAPAEAKPAESTDQSAEADAKTTAEQQAQETTSEQAAAPVAAEATTTDKTKKVSPWKLVDQFKERATKAEARILELEKQIEPEEARKQAKAKFDEMERRATEMAEELRYYNAEKYDPDVIKAKENYTRAFNRAMGELKSVIIKDPSTEQPRALTVNDLADLAFMDLGQATQVAKEVFGDVAPYVMDHRNEIRRLWDEQQAVLEGLKKNGAERERSRMETFQKNNSAMMEQVSKSYQEANAAAAADPKSGHFFKPREGDTEWNSRLEKGYKLVDEAFATNVLDPKLTQEQRTELIRKHAAVRNRAAAFGPLRHEVESLKKKLAEADAELKEFKETTPAAAGRSSESAPAKPRGMAGLVADLRKIAH